MGTPSDLRRPRSARPTWGHTETGASPPGWWALSGHCRPALLTRALALQTVQDGRQFLKYVDPRLGVPLPERDYGGNCLIYDADNKTDPFHNVWVSARERSPDGPHAMGAPPASQYHVLGVKLADYWTGSWALPQSWVFLEPESFCRLDGVGAPGLSGSRVRVPSGGGRVPSQRALGDRARGLHLPHRTSWTALCLHTSSAGT